MCHVRVRPHFHGHDALLLMDDRPPGHKRTPLSLSCHLCQNLEIEITLPHAAVESSFLSPIALDNNLFYGGGPRRRPASAAAARKRAPCVQFPNSRYVLLETNSWAALVPLVPHSTQIDHLHSNLSSIRRSVHSKTHATHKLSSSSVYLYWIRRAIPYV